MIKILNSEDKNKTKLVSKETYKESLINSFADGIIGHFNDADFFFTDIDNGYLSYVAKSIDSEGFKTLVKELKEEGYVQDLEALNLEDQIQYIYQNRLVDNYDLYELIDTSKLADLMMENKCGWIFSIDDTDNSFYTDLADLDLTEVTPNKKKYGIGDSVKFKDGRVGIVEDYDEKYYYIKDNNTNIVKILKDNTPKDYTSIQNMTSRLKTIIKETSTFQNDKNFGAVEFKKLLEANGFEVEYVENKSGTWQKDDYNEYFKNYDIKLVDGQHIYFRVIADDNFNTKEVICYLNGKNW